MQDGEGNLPVSDKHPRSATEVKYAAGLFEKRKQLHKLASQLLEDDMGPWIGTDEDNKLEVGHFAEEVHALLRREYEARLALLDEELNALGIPPEPLEPLA